MEARIIEFQNIYQDKIIDLILKIQNDEYNINLSIDEQMDLLNIENEYVSNGGNFWITIDCEDNVIGTIGLLKLTDDVAVLKKFFVDSRFRGKDYSFGAKLYDKLLSFAKRKGFRYIILDTPSVATRSHNFYRKVGFRVIEKEELPAQYTYPDRDSLLFLLEIK